MSPMITGEVPEEQLLPDAMRTLHDGDWEQCEDCLKYFIWDKIPDEYVKIYREYHGQPNLTPEVVPVGWDCPICGHYNSL